MSDPKPIVATVKLRDPVKLGDQVVTELTFRKPVAKDFRRMPLEPRMGDMLDLVGALSGQLSVVIDQLGVADLTEVTALVAGFMPGGRPTGGTP